MRVVILSAAILLAVQTCADAADPTNWMGVKVMPKLNAVVKVGNQVIAEKDLTEIPWIVQDVNGEWLWVGYARKGWVQRGQVVTLDEAPAYYTQVINSGDNKQWAYIGRGTVWQYKGDLDLAIADFGEALRITPKATVYCCRANAWATKKEYAKAISDYNEAFILDPKFSGIYNSAAWLRATCTDDRYRDGNKAVELATKGCELTGWVNPAFLDTLAAAHAEEGNFALAMKYENKAIALSPNIDGYKRRLALYEDHKPFRDE